MKYNQLMDAMLSEAVCMLDEHEYPITGIAHDLDELLFLHDKKGTSLGKIKHFDITMEFSSFDMNNTIEELRKTHIIPAMDALKNDKLKHLKGEFVSLMLGVNPNNSYVVCYKNLVLRITIDHQRAVLNFDMALLQINQEN